MKIAVFLGSSDVKDPLYKEEAVKLGEWMAKNGHVLVYGGSKAGLMGDLAEAVLDNGGHVIGVITEQLNDMVGSVDGQDELIVVKTMGERKQLMLEKADMALAFPGGIGTLEEIFEAMSREKLGIDHAPAAFYNIDGYYDHLYALFARMVQLGFLPRQYADLVRMFDNLDELAQFVLETEKN